MANIAHASLTGAELHEPKGASTATLGTVYVANGSGSGSWATVGTSSFTGMIADFTWPVVQDGWLELDGTDVNTTTYSALYNVMTIQQTGTRTNGVATITSLTSTANMRVGYYVFGTDIASGTTILTIDSGTQITMSGNASSSGSATVVVSPWLLNTGTVRLPNVSAAGRYRRSRTSSTAVGQLQADQNKAHTHTFSVTSATATGTTTPTFTGTSGSLSVTGTLSRAAGNSGGGSTGLGLSGNSIENLTMTSTGSFTPVGTSSSIASHTHSVSGTTASDGSSEIRPLSIVVMTCVKT